MVSPALTQLLERARLRLGLEVEILDTGLNNLYPEGGTELTRIIDSSPEIRRVLLNALAGGRTERVDSPAADYFVYPLRPSPERRSPAGLLAVRRPLSHAPQAADAEPWSEVARAIVETNLSAAETLSDERQRSRRFSGALRFVEHLLETADEGTLTRSLVQAAAIWYDVDARIYRRDLRGEFVLNTWLPGVRPEASSRRLLPEIAVDSVHRLASASVLGETAAGHDALILPLAAKGGPEWLLAVIGSVPGDADPILQLIGRVAGAQLATFAERKAKDARQRFDSLLAETTKAPELVAMHVIHRLAETVDASSATLTVIRNGQTRRLAAVGTAAAAAVTELASEDVLAPDRLKWTIRLGQQHSAVLDLRAAAGHEFDAGAACIGRAGADALRTWLAGTLAASGDQATFVDDVTSVAAPPFTARIQEELERARRFDLRLSLILIDAGAPSDAIRQLQETVRQELRGSDVTGAMGGTQVAALLTHTDALGLDRVVRRVRQRLADAAERWNLADLRLGQAAVSPDVRTADALLERALRDAEPVIVH